MPMLKLSLDTDTYSFTNKTRKKQVTLKRHS